MKWPLSKTKKEDSHKPPFRSPAPPALEAPRQWELTAAEVNYQAVSKATFRTGAFKNLSNPDMPHEYLEADYLAAEKQWRVRSCIVGKGRALAALFPEPAETSSVATETQKSRTVLQTKSVMEALHKLSLYEFGTDTTGEFTFREAVEEDLGEHHFISFAHAEGIIFDTNGHPTLTENGSPARDGEFPLQELICAEEYHNNFLQQKQCPVIIRASDITPIFQEAGKMDGFDTFSNLIQAEKYLKDAVSSIEASRQGLVYDQYDDDPYKEVGKPKRWISKRLSLIDSTFSIHQSLERAGNRVEALPELREAIKDSGLTLKIIQAGFSVSMYQNRKAYFEDLSCTGPHANMEKFLKNVDVALAESEFDDSKKAQIRSFIMKDRPVSDFAEGLESLGKSVQSILDSVSTQAANILRESQPKPKILTYSPETMWWKKTPLYTSSEKLLKKAYR